jgi:hypothetical protein
MLIEYKITFAKDGVTITQRVEPNSSTAPTLQPSATGDLAVAKHLGKTFAASQGGGPGDEGDIGSGGPGSMPVAILGPIIIGGSNGASNPAVAGKGGGPGDEGDIGSGGPKTNAAGAPGA